MDEEEFEKLKKAAMAKLGKVEPLRCAFCGKDPNEVKDMFAGPGVLICDECVELANDVFKERRSEERKKGRGID